MSEIIHCPECGHRGFLHTALHNKGTCGAGSCGCIRSYESLVGEMPQVASVGDVYVRDSDHRKFYCHEVNEWTEIEEKPEPSLQLLVIDLGGNQCVVKVEKGDQVHIAHGTSGHLIFGLGVVPMPFTELREAIEGVKPVPRIERVDESYHVWGEPSSAIPLVHLSKYSYNALSALAGKPLPIWTGGTWEDLLPRPEMGIGWELPIGVWRYKRA